MKLELMAGSHRVELRLDGFKPWVSDVQVQANEPLTLGPVRLGLPDGRLAVRSAPAGANVTVGGAYRGRTPLEIDVRPDVEQAVAVLREGYEPAQPPGERPLGRARGRRVHARADPGRGDRALDARGRAGLRGRRGARRRRADAAAAGDRAGARGAQAGLRDPPRHRHAAARPAADPRGDAARGRGARARRGAGRRRGRDRARCAGRRRATRASGRRRDRSRRSCAARRARSSSSCRPASSRWAARAARPVAAPTRRSAR